MRIGLSISLLFWLGLFLLLSGCSHAFLEVGIGDNSGDNWNDCGETGHYIGAGFTGPITKQTSWEAGYGHYSQLACGFSVKDPDESSLDTWGAKVRTVFDL